MESNSYNTRYQSPAMRGQAGRSMETAPHGTDEPNPMEQPAEPASANDKQPSGFAAADVFGGTPPKEGAEYTIKITAIDPDTREAEFEVVGGGGEEKPESEEPAAPEADPAGETAMEGMG